MFVIVVAVLQTKRAYEKASEEGEMALHTLEKADNDPNSTKAKIDKVRFLKNMYYSGLFHELCIC